MPTEAELLAELNTLASKYPDAVRKAAEANPELAKPVIDYARAKHAGQEFTPEAFADWFYVMNGYELAPFAMDSWVPAIFAEFLNKDKDLRGVLNKASRGFTKSTVSISFCLFCHGHFPHGSGLILQARDEDAKKTIDLMAETVEKSNAWKTAFPHVQPDTQRGWSERGYFVRDTRKSAEEWIKLTTQDHGRDPTFNAKSIIAGSIGMHPTLYLALDDIHDQKNTASTAERDAVKKTFNADIVPIMSRPGQKPFLLVSYTPWSDDDTYADPLEKSGVYVQLTTPAFRFDPDGDEEWEGKKICLMWPELYGVSFYRAIRKVNSKREFGRSFLCSLEHGKGEALRFYPYPHLEVSYDWPTNGGIDPPYDDKVAGEDVHKHSKFGFAYLAKLPMGGAVVIDGILQLATLNDMEKYILNAQTMFSNWGFSYLEDVAGGKVARQALQRNSNIRIVGSDLYGLIEKSGRMRNKRDRIYTELAPWFENMTIRISDADTPFLTALRKGLDRFYELDEHDEAWDALDAVYHAAKSMPDILVVREMQEQAMQIHRRRAMSESPLAGMADYRGYGR